MHIGESSPYRDSQNGKLFYLFGIGIWNKPNCFCVTLGIEDTFTTSEIQTQLPNFVNLEPFIIILTWPVGAEVTCYLRNNMVIAPLSIGSQIKIRLTAWPKLGIHTRKLQNIANKATWYRCCYFTVVKVASVYQHGLDTKSGTGSIST